MPHRGEGNVNRVKIGVILAGGAGVRSGSNVNKVFVDLAGVSLLRRSVKQFASVCEALVVVTAEKQRAAVALDGIEVRFVDGGKTRQASEAAGIAAALELSRNEDDLIAVHDAARPLVSTALIRAVFEAILPSSVAYAAIPRSGIWTVDGDGLPTSPATQELLAAQTPQAARADVFESALRRGVMDGQATDTVAAVTQALPDTMVIPVDGDEQNMKVTWPQDFARAERLIARSLPASPDRVDVVSDKEQVVTDETEIDEQSVEPAPASTLLVTAEAAIADAQVALDCLAVPGNVICPTCQAAEADGSLESRPALARCVASKRANAS